MSNVYFRSIWNTNNTFIKNGAINTPSYTTTDQDNLIAEHGQLIYNSTTNSIKFYSSSGSWNNILPTDNITIGNLNFNNNTISSVTGDIILFPNSTIVKITGSLNMQTNNITNVGTINGLSLPNSNFVGINDSQIITNKTIDAAQLLINTVSLGKMSQLSANTIIGNNTGALATPLALTTAQVKTMLSLTGINSGDQTITLTGDVTGFGTGSFATTIADNAVTTSKIIDNAVTRVKIVDNAINMSKLAHIAANTLIGNNTGSTGSPAVLDTGSVKYMLSLDLVENTRLSTWAGSINITSIADNIITTSRIVNNAVTLGKIATIPPTTVIGNNTGSDSTPMTININDLRTMLNLNLVENTALSTWTGSTYITTIADNAVTTAKIANSAVSLTKMASLKENTIIGNNTGIPATPLALSTSQVKTMIGLDNNFTIGNINFTNNTISSTTGSLIAASNFITFQTQILLSLTSFEGILITTGDTSIQFINSTSTIKLKGTLDMQTYYNIINLGTINGYSLPSSTFVGINDSQTLTNKTIDASQLVTNSVSLAKMAQLPANTIIGNNTGSSATPLALTTAQVKSLLLLNDVDNVSINSWAGSTNITTVGTVTSGSLGSGFGVVNSTIIKCDTISAQTDNTNLTLNGRGNNAGVITNNYFLRINSSITNSDSYLGIDGPTITNGRYIACYQNGVFKLSFGLSASSYFFVSDAVSSLVLFRANMGGGNNCIQFPTYSTNGVLRIDSGVVTVDSNFTTSTNTINVDTIIAKTTNSPLYLYPNGTGNVVTNSHNIYIASNKTNTDTGVMIDGPTTSNARYIGCYQNGAYKLGFGLMASSYYFIWDNVLGNDLFRANLGGGNDCIRFPTYSTNGILRIDGGVVTVDSNFTTSTNTINVDTVIAKTTNSILYIHPNGTGNVVTNSPIIYIASNRTNTDCYVGIDGPTTTNGRYIACYQNGVYKCGFGLSGTAYYFIRDNALGSDIFRAKMGGGLCIVLPTYSTSGTLQMITGSVVSNTSDRRLKQNEEVLIPSISLQQVLNLQPKKYSWNADIDRTQIGFIAQDVETVIPDAIDGKKYEYEFVRDGASQDSDGTVRVDEEGNPVLDYNRPRYRGLDQCAILAVLVSAVQELTNRVIELESKFGETPQE